jgi:hypothetical protein
LTVTVTGWRSKKAASAVRPRGIMSIVSRPEAAIPTASGPSSQIHEPCSAGSA